MKRQVSRLSPHQNGKVFGVLMALSSLVLMVPLTLVMSATAPESARPPMFMLLLMPVIYLVFGYISVAIGCAIYNAMYKVVGGIEYETDDSAA